MEGNVGPQIEKRIKKKKKEHTVRIQISWIFKPGVAQYEK